MSEKSRENLERLLEMARDAQAARGDAATVKVLKLGHYEFDAEVGLFDDGSGPRGRVGFRHYNYTFVTFSAGEVVAALEEIARGGNHG
jgi:hypothetical protein